MRVWPYALVVFRGDDISLAPRNLTSDASILQLSHWHFVDLPNVRAQYTRLGLLGF